MKKNNGFTLIELLGTIVLLSIIAMVVSPPVINQIKKANNKIDKASMNIIYEAGTAYIKENENSYDMKKNAKICLKVKVLADNSNLKESFIKQQKVDLNKILGITVGDNNNLLYDLKLYEACSDFGGVEIPIRPTPTIPDEKYENGTIIYYDPRYQKKCHDYVVANSNTGNKEGCMKWYIFNDEAENSTVNLLLDHDTSDSLWNSERINTVMKEVAAALIDDTRDWSSSLHPRLITADEIAKITGNPTWKSATSTTNFYFDTNTEVPADTCKDGNTTGCNYSWLKGDYWTTSPYAGTSGHAWCVHGGWYLSRNPVNYSHGVRPVITIIKSELK